MADIKPSVLVVDDEMSIRESFLLILCKEFNIITAASGEAALKKIIDEKVDLVYLDIRMPGMNGIDTLKRIKEIDPSIDVIMVTAINDIASAGSAVKHGAKDYVVKPFEVSDILNKTRSIIIKTQTKNMNLLETEELIGSSNQILEIEKTIARESKKDSSILIIGEKGTEAELIAKIISIENEKTLKILNISGDFKDTLLFGYEKGSFINAFEKEVGALEEANGGILYIRNIELLPIETQIKLRRALQNQKISREGSFAPIQISVRIISETQEGLKELAASGAFDPELYALLSNVTIMLPSLKERESDIPVLVNYYLDKFNKKYSKDIQNVTQEVMDILTGYSWPGNTAELSNVMETLVLTTARDELIPEDLPLDILMKSSQAGRQLITMDNLANKLEKNYILNIYHKAGQNTVKAANILGIHLKTLEAKLESYSS